MKDWYKILELPSNTGGITDSEVKEAYYRLAKLHHPDASKASSPEAVAAAKEQFRLISQAYENLKTIDARRAYRFETQADENWQRAKSGQKSPSAKAGYGYQDAQMEFDVAEKKWRQANYKTHERSMKFMRGFERAVHPKMLFFIIPCGLLVYYGLSTGAKFVYRSIEEFSKPTIDEEVVTASTKALRIKKRKAIGKAAIDMAEKEMGGEMVKVWLNKASGKYELPAPWNKAFDPKNTMYVPREQVGTSPKTRSP